MGQIFSDSIENTGWTATDVSGTAANWTYVTTSGTPTATPYNGTYMGKFNSYTAAANTSCRFSRDATFNISASSTSASASFYIFHSTIGTELDSIQLQISTDGTNWTNIGSAILRDDGSDGWKLHTLDISAYIGQSNLHIGFLGLSKYGYNIYLDLVTATEETITSVVKDVIGGFIPFAR